VELLAVVKDFDSLTDGGFAFGLRGEPAAMLKVFHLGRASLLFVKLTRRKQRRGDCPRC